MGRLPAWMGMTEHSLQLHCWKHFVWWTGSRSCHCLTSHRIKHRKKNDFSSFHFCLIPLLPPCFLLTEANQRNWADKGDWIFSGLCPLAISAEHERTRWYWHQTDKRPWVLLLVSPSLLREPTPQILPTYTISVAARILQFSLSCDFLCLLSYEWKELCVSTVIL